MGLDGVELVMAVEAEFSLQIDDSEAEKLLRVGDLFQFVLQTLRQRGETVDEAAVWAKVKQLVVEQLGVKPEHVIPSARFIEDLRMD